MYLQPTTRIKENLEEIIEVSYQVMMDDASQCSASGERWAMDPVHPQSCRKTSQQDRLLWHSGPKGYDVTYLQVLAPTVMYFTLRDRGCGVAEEFQIFTPSAEEATTRLVAAAVLTQAVIPCVVWGDELLAWIHRVSTFILKYWHSTFWFPKVSSKRRLKFWPAPSRIRCDGPSWWLYWWLDIPAKRGEEDILRDGPISTCFAFISTIHPHQFGFWEKG
jgi:hypothetical protein